MVLTNYNGVVDKLLMMQRTFVSVHQSRRKLTENSVGTTSSSATVLDTNWPVVWTQCYRLKVMPPLCLVIREQQTIIIKQHPLQGKLLLVSCVLMGSRARISLVKPSFMCV